MTGEIKTTRNIRIYLHCIFYVRSGPNQSYYPDCDWEGLPPSSTRNEKGRSSKLIKRNIVRLSEVDSED